MRPTLVFICAITAATLLCGTLSGCGLVASKAVSEAFGSSKDLQIMGDTASPIVIGSDPRRFWAEGEKITGSTKVQRADWSVTPASDTPTAWGFVIDRGDHIDFVATNEGKVRLRADAKVSGLGGSLVATADLTIVRRGSIPSPAAVWLEPTEGPPGTSILVKAELPADAPTGLLVFARNTLGSDPVPLLDDGVAPDDKAGDGIYTGIVTLPGLPKPGPTRIGAYATDGKGNTSNWSWAEFNVKS
ncbi:MAG: choice-of-anchor X domain-containing protein [Armatimonadota bacterium]